MGEIFRPLLMKGETSLRLKKKMQRRRRNLISLEESSTCMFPKYTSQVHTFSEEQALQAEGLDLIILQQKHGGINRAKN